MKWITVIVLVILAFTVLAPLSSFARIIDRQEQPLLGSLDVCNSAAPALSANGEMPCMTASIGIAAPPVFQATNEPLQHVFTELILSCRNEQPPRS